MKAFWVLLLAAVDAGAEGGAFLKIQPGPRPMALGEAYTAVADDLNAVNTNPAGLGRMAGRQLSFSHVQLYEGAKLDAFSAGTQNVAVSFQRLGQGRLEGRDEQGRPTGSYGAADTAVALSGAYNGLGATVKFLDSRLADRSASSYAVDLGAMRAWRGLNFGVSARNLGPGLRYSDQTEALPTAVALGAATRLGGVLLVSVDVAQRVATRRTVVAVGTEYAVHPAFSLRAGSGLTGMNGMGLGFGFKVRGVGVDYAFSPAGELGSAQRVGLSTRF